MADFFLVPQGIIYVIIWVNKMNSRRAPLHHRHRPIAMPRRARARCRRLLIYSDRSNVNSNGWDSDKTMHRQIWTNNFEGEYSLRLLNNELKLPWIVTVQLLSDPLTICFKRLAIMKKIKSSTRALTKLGLYVCVEFANRIIGR